ncbi:MAG: diguanylate cyclase [Gemmatimonadaceae bacterium]
MGKARILIADGDQVMLRTVSWLLKEHGYDVCVAPAGDRLLEVVTANRPDLLLVDVSVLNGQGASVLENIRTREQWRDMRVVVVSANGADERAARLLGSGATDVIGKPLFARELLARIQVQLRIRQELVEARQELESTEVALKRARDEAENRRKLVDILHEVSGDFAAEELCHLLVRRVARALGISHCSLVLARAGDERGVVATAQEGPGLRNEEIEIDAYPELRAALESGQPVLVEDVEQSPLFDDARELWARTGAMTDVHSVIALPFTLDSGGRQSGVFLLRTMRGEPALTVDDVEFADTVVKAAAAAMRRAHAIESSRADNARLEILAITDPLTLTLNRRALMDRLGSELDRARRYALVLSVLMIDIDHFKGVNDQHGHAAGDEVLRGVAQVLQREARSVDVVARYGGEEFLVVLPETGEDGAYAFAERVCRRVAEDQIVAGSDFPDLRATVSVGVATFPSPGVESTEALIGAADAAMYRAKAGGRNQVAT